MIRATQFVFSVLLALFSLHIHAEELTCATEQRFKGGESKGASATVKVEAGKLVSLSIESFYASGREGGGYFCFLETSDPDSESKWILAGDTTILEVTSKSISERSHIWIESHRDGYKIILKDVWMGYCGFGAEWPASIEIAKGKKKCNVAY